ncbi:hypothetical protein [Chthoniobacter flavus]|nr:hypothetical protein [Chthoniobacter flavus]
MRQSDDQTIRPGDNERSVLGDGILRRHLIVQNDRPGHAPSHRMSALTALRPLRAFVFFFLFLTAVAVARAEEIDVPSPHKKYALRGNSGNSGELAIVRLEDGKKVADLLSPADGITLGGAKARWSPDEKWVVVLISRRKLYDLDILVRAEDGRYVEREITTPELEKVFQMTGDEAARLDGEDAALGPWAKGPLPWMKGALTVWSDGWMRTDSGESQHYVYRYAIMLAQGKPVIREIKKVGIFSDKQFETFRRKLKQESGVDL